MEGDGVWFVGVVDQRAEGGKGVFRGLILSCGKILGVVGKTLGATGSESARSGLMSTRQQLKPSGKAQGFLPLLVELLVAGHLAEVLFYVVDEATKANKCGLATRANQVLADGVKLYLRVSQRSNGW